MSRENQREWVPARGEPIGCFLSPGIKFRSDRPVAGTLRFGTEPRIGPNGPLPVGRSDMGMDRITPRGCDPIGTSIERYIGKPPMREAKLIAQEVRQYKSRDKY